MTPLEKIQSLTSYTDYVKINVYIEMTQDEIKEICKLDSYITELDNVLVEMVIIKLNRLGNEGLTSVSMNGASESYLNDYPENIKKRLAKYTKRVVMK